jgi:hypothetical protein
VSAILKVRLWEAHAKAIPLRLPAIKRLLANRGRSIPQLERSVIVRDFMATRPTVIPRLFVDRRSASKEIPEREREPAHSRQGLQRQTPRRQARG